LQGLLGALTETQAFVLECDGGSIYPFLGSQPRERGTMKIKMLGLGVLAMLAVGGIGALNASAIETGHIGSSTSHTVIKGQESGTSHRIHLTGDGLEGQFGCTTATWEGTLNAGIAKTVEVTPTYSGCTTTNTSTTVSITHNGCKYRFKVEAGGTDGTVDLSCPAGKAIEMHHPNCTITIRDRDTSGNLQNQTIPGIHYTTVIENRHSLTVDVNLAFADEYHGGVCIFLGTHHTGFLKGSVTVKGFDTEGKQVDITAT
jgi:hypothetical protein